MNLQTPDHLSAIPPLSFLVPYTPTVLPPTLRPARHLSPPFACAHATPSPHAWDKIIWILT